MYPARQILVLLREGGVDEQDRATLYRGAGGSYVARCEQRRERASSCNIQRSERAQDRLLESRIPRRIGREAVA